MTYRSFTATLLFIFFTVPSMGGTIFLKDGEMVKSEKIWEKNGYIHFILSGTKRVEIRYAKEIVDRIEGVPEFSKKMAGKSIRFNSSPSGGGAAVPLEKNTSAKSSPHHRQLNHPGENSSRSIVSVSQNGPMKHQKTASATQGEKDGGNYSNQSAEKSNHHLKTARLKYHRNEFLKEDFTGVAFYDPRRAEKYWSSRISRHQNIKNAVAALAEAYHQSPAWVIANMGKTNDLGIIHKNLTESVKRRSSIIQARTSNETLPVNISEDDRRTASALSNSSPEDNGLPPANQLKITEDFLFYDPHRPLKYWSDQKTGHRNFGDAINALSRVYNRPPEWIEEHMGRFNNLAQIHQNLRRSLQQ